MTVLSLLCVFHAYLNPFITSGIMSRFKMVSSTSNLLVHFINVDQADAIAINLPDDKIMLIDSGSKEFNVTYANYLKENVLHTKKNNKIDYLVLSHADSDHVGGTMKLLKTFDVRMVFLPTISSDSQTYQELYNYIVTNCSYQFLGDEFVMSSNQYEFLFFEQMNMLNTNDSSQLIKLKYKNKSFLFTGDLSSNVEDDYILEYGNKLSCDVLKVAHHGGKSSTSEDFLNSVNPNYAVISVGAENSYGHPTAEVLSRLNAKGIETLRTDLNGNILFVVGDDYDLKVVTGIYYITNMPLDYRTYILVFDVVLFVVAIVVIVKKEKKKNKHLSDDFLE